MHFFSNTQLDSMREQLETILRTFDNARAIRESINDHKGLNDTVARKNDSVTNPESYYKFQVFDKGVAIVWSAFTWNEQLQKMSRAKTWRYSICCYGFTPIENKELMRRVNYTNNCFGEYDSIEDALPKYYEVVLQLIESLRKKEPKKEYNVYIYNNNNTVELWKSGKNTISLYYNKIKDFTNKIIRKISTLKKGVKNDKLHSTCKNTKQKQGITFSELYYCALWEMLKL